MLLLSFISFLLAITKPLESLDTTISGKTANAKDDSCTKDSCSKSKRYLLYDVNPGEGFNLRRDVFIRAATLVRHLNEHDSKSEWTLVLPPWGPLYHWKRQDINQEGMPWSSFFNVDKLNEFIPAIEFDDYLAERKQPVIDRLFYLMNFDFNKIDLQSEWLLEEAECSDIAGLPYHPDNEGHIRGAFWGYDGIFAKALSCFQAFGTASTVIPMLLKMSNVRERAVMFDRFETALHDHFGDVNYWNARRSMPFADHLIQIGNDFLKDAFEYSPAKMENEVSGGASFICAHLRRRDYLRARPDELPSMREAALQLRKILKETGLTTVFVATDGTAEELQELRSNLPSATVVTYSPSHDILRKIKEGGAAIAEQIICSHSRVFIGSHESTFSFRIQEEREIMGFRPETTFRRFCKFSDQFCEQPTRWLVVPSNS